MPTDIFPEINIPVVTVIWQYTGLSPQEMEQRVTTYSQYSHQLERQRHQEHRSADAEGSRSQKIYFQPDVNIDLAISADRLRHQLHPRADAAGHPAADHRPV